MKNITQKQTCEREKNPTHNSHDVWCDVTSSARDKIHNKYKKNDWSYLGYHKTITNFFVHIKYLVFFYINFSSRTDLVWPYLKKKVNK